MQYMIIPVPAWTIGAMGAKNSAINNVRVFTLLHFFIKVSVDKLHL